MKLTRLDTITKKKVFGQNENTDSKAVGLLFKSFMHLRLH